MGYSTKMIQFNRSTPWGALRLVLGLLCFLSVGKAAQARAQRELKKVNDELRPLSLASKYRTLTTGELARMTELRERLKDIRLEFRKAHVLERRMGLHSFEASIHVGKPVGYL